MADELDNLKGLVEEQSRMAIEAVDHSKELIHAADVGRDVTPVGSDIAAVGSEITPRNSQIDDLKNSLDLLAAKLLTQTALTNNEIQTMAKKMDKRQDLIMLQLALQNACCGEFEYHVNQQQAYEVAKRLEPNMKARYLAPGKNCYLKSGYMVKQILMSFMRGATLESHTGGIYIQGYVLLPDQCPREDRVDKDVNRDLFNSKIKNQIHGLLGSCPRIEKTEKGQFVMFRHW